MKRLIRMGTIASAVLLSIPAVILGTGSASSGTTPRLTTMTIPVPVQEALFMVADSRKAGPLTIDTTRGSVSGDVWATSSQGQSPGVVQHWSLAASDNAGSVVLGIIVSSDGTEVVSAWVPGASQSSNWIFNTADPSLVAAQEVTVSGTVETITPSSTASTASTASLGPNSQVSPADVYEYCTQYVGQPYLSGSYIYYSGFVSCNVSALISDTLNLWDYYNNYASYNVAVTGSLGVGVDSVSGDHYCTSGYAPRNLYDTSLYTAITWPPGTIPATGSAYFQTPSIGLPCHL